MKNDILVSIITPSYNCSRFIKDTIESVIRQTYQNWELLITDDCSTDNSAGIIRRYAEKDSRIKLFMLPTNSGAGIARNNSIREAKGRFIAYLDSDDRWYPWKLETQIMFMLENHYAISYASYLTCDEGGKNTGIIVCRRKETFYTIKRDDKIGFLTMMYDVEKCGKVELPLMRNREDWAHKINLMKNGTVAYGIKEPLGIYRLVSNSLSSNKKVLIKHNIHVYREVLGWSKLRATMFFYTSFLPTHFLKRLRVWYINK